MPAQRFHDLQALRHRRAEVPRAVDEIALVEVVGAHAVLHQLVVQVHDDVRAVIDAGEQHGLAAEGDARVRQPRQRLFHFRRDLVRVVEVDVHPYGMVFRQHRRQLRGDALRQEDGHARADADDFDVRDGAQAEQDALQDVLRQRQWIAAGEQYVADFGRGGDVVQLLLVGGGVEHHVAIADQTAARAKAAVAGALRRQQHQDAVGIAMDQPGDRGMGVLAERVGHFRVERDQFLRGGDHLPPDGTIRIVRVHQAGEIGCHIDVKVAGCRKASDLIGG